MPGPATSNMVWRELVIAGGDLIGAITARSPKKEPDRTRPRIVFHEGKEY